MQPSSSWRRLPRILSASLRAYPVSQQVALDNDRREHIGDETVSKLPTSQSFPSLSGEL